MGTGGRPRKVKRHFMWLNYLRPTRRGSERRAGRVHFRTAAPKPPERAQGPERTDREDQGSS